MATIKQMDKKQKEFILNLNARDLKNYIDNLTKQYYFHLSKNEEKNVVSIIDLLNKIIELRSGENVENYINYSLIKNFNNILFKSVEHNSDINFIDIKEPGLNKVDNSDVFAESQLEKIIKHFENEKSFKYCDELHERLKTDEDIKEYFHYNDYLIK